MTRLSLCQKVAAALDVNLVEHKNGEYLMLADGNWRYRYDSLPDLARHLAKMVEDTKEPETIKQFCEIYQFARWPNTPLDLAHPYGINTICLDTAKRLAAMLREGDDTTPTSCKDELQPAMLREGGEEEEETTTATEMSMILNQHRYLKNEFQTMIDNAIAEHEAKMHGASGKPCDLCNDKGGYSCSVQVGVMYTDKDEPFCPRCGKEKVRE